MILSKSESNDVFSSIKVGKIIKENLIEGDRLLNNLSQNIDVYLKEEIKTTKLELSKEQNIKMNKIETKVNELINKNYDLKDKNKRYYEIANKASDLLTKHNIEHTQLEELKSVLNEERQIIKMFEQEKNTLSQENHVLSSDNRILKSKLSEIEEK